MPDAYFYRTVFWLREFGVLPEPGGLNQQDAAWVMDIERYWRALSEKRRDAADLKKDLEDLHRGM